MNVFEVNNTQAETISKNFAGEQTVSIKLIDINEESSETLSLKPFAPEKDNHFWGVVVPLNSLDDYIFNTYGATYILEQELFTEEGSIYFDEVVAHAYKKCVKSL